MVASINIVDELLKWAIPAACLGIVGIVKLSFNAIAHLKDVGRKVEDLHGYTRYHLGPNGDSPAIHARLAELERFHGIHEQP